MNEKKSLEGKDPWGYKRLVDYTVRHSVVSVRSGSLS